MDIHSYDKWELAKSYDTYFDLKMPNGADGIMCGEPYVYQDLGGIQGSDFHSDYEAPETGYENSIHLYTKREQNEYGRGKIDTNNDNHILYYFRIRTQTNELGQVTNAYYGKIYGEIDGGFTYYLNLTPNDRNVEYNPNENLNPAVPRGERYKP